MPNVFEVRRENLRKLVLDKFEGNRAAFSRAAEVHQNQINLLLTDNDQHRRNLGESLSRRMETTLGLRPGFLDETHPDNPMDVVVAIKAMVVPPEMAHIFRTDDQISTVCYFQSWLNSLHGRVTSVDNLALCRVSTMDMAPEIGVDDHLIVDTAVKAVTADGIYVLQRGNDTFLRRVTKQLTGGYMVSSGKETVEVESLKGIKAAARVVIQAHLTIK